jgi:hypothetical protein
MTLPLIEEGHPLWRVPRCATCGHLEVMHDRGRVCAGPFPPFDPPGRKGARCACGQFVRPEPPAGDEGVE